MVAANSESRVATAPSRTSAPPAGDFHGQYQMEPDDPLCPEIIVSAVAAEVQRIVSIVSMMVAVDEHTEIIHEMEALQAGCFEDELLNPGGAKQGAGPKRNQPVSDRAHNVRRRWRQGQLRAATKVAARNEPSSTADRAHARRTDRDVKSTEVSHRERLARLQQVAASIQPPVFASSAYFDAKKKFQLRAISNQVQCALSPRCSNHVLAICPHGVPRRGYRVQPAWTEHEHKHRVLCQRNQVLLADKQLGRGRASIHAYQQSKSTSRHDRAPARPDAIAIPRELQGSGEAPCATYPAVFPGASGQSSKPKRGWAVSPDLASTLFVNSIDMVENQPRSLANVASDSNNCSVQQHQVTDDGVKCDMLPHPPTLPASESKRRAVRNTSENKQLKNHLQEQPLHSCGGRTHNPTRVKQLVTLLLGKHAAVRAFEAAARCVPVVDQRTNLTGSDKKANKPWKPKMDTSTKHTVTSGDGREKHNVRKQHIYDVHPHRSLTPRLKGLQILQATTVSREHGKKLKSTSQRLGDVVTKACGSGGRGRHAKKKKASTRGLRIHARAHTRALHGRGGTDTYAQSKDTPRRASRAAIREPQVKLRYQGTSTSSSGSSLA